MPKDAAMSRRAFVWGTLALAALAAIVVAPELLGDRIGAALGEIAAASPGWLWLAGASFVASLAAMGAAWCAALRSVGARTTAGDSAARYAAGSLVNAVAPAGAGGAVRIALFSRVLEGRDRLWTTGGVAAVVGAGRMLSLAILVLVAGLVGAFPLWPVLVCGAVVAAAVAVAVVARGWRPRAHVAHVLDVFRALAAVPRCALEVAGWTFMAIATRVVAAVCVAAALGVPGPVEVALVAIPAFALAGILPLTPGNVGVGSGAVALALHAGGLDGTSALSVGIAFQALETAVSVTAGAAGAVVLARLPIPAWTMRLAGAGAGVLLAGAFGATVLV